MSLIGIDCGPRLWFSYDTHHLHIRSHIHCIFIPTDTADPRGAAEQEMGSIWQWIGYPSQDTFLGLQLAPLAWIDRLGGLFDLVRYLLVGIYTSCNDARYIIYCTIHRDLNL